jgi:hypothetical protein
MNGRFRRRGAMLPAAATLSVVALVSGAGTAVAAAAPVTAYSPAGAYGSTRISPGGIGNGGAGQLPGFISHSAATNPLAPQPSGSAG